MHPRPVPSQQQLLYQPRVSVPQVTSQGSWTFPSSHPTRSTEAAVPGEAGLGLRAPQEGLTGPRLPLSALLGFLLLLATVRLKSRFSLQHFGAWIFLSKVIVSP